MPRGSGGSWEELGQASPFGGGQRNRQHHITDDDEDEDDAAAVGVGGGFGIRRGGVERRAVVEDSLQQGRKVTDPCCLSVFALFWVGMLCGALFALARGDPRRLTHGLDYKGQLCGVEGEVGSKPLVYWPDPNRPWYPVCVASCPAGNGDFVSLPSEEVSSSRSRNGSVVSLTITSTSRTVRTYRSRKVAQRYCLPLAEALGVESVERGAQGLQGLGLLTARPVLGQLSRALADLQAAAPVLLLSIPFALLLGYVYLAVLRVLAPMVTWGLLGGTVLVCLGFCAYCMHVAGARDNEVGGAGTAGPSAADSPQQQGSSQQVVVLAHFVGDSAKWSGFLASLSALAGVVLVGLLICLRQKVQRAISCVRAACDAIWQVPSMLLLPATEVLGKLLFAALWALPFLWVLSCGHLQPHQAEIDGKEVALDPAKELAYSDQEKALILYYLFGLLWGLETITALFQFTTAYAVARWYFTECDPDGSKPRHLLVPAWRGLAMALRYHLGSLVLGGFLTAFVRPVRAILEYLTAQASAAGAPNRVVECCLGSCAVCVWCFEQLIRFVNKNAYIQMAIRSSDFWLAARRAVRTLLEGAPEVAFLAGLTSVFRWIGVCACSALTAFLALHACWTMDAFAGPDSDRLVQNPPLVAGAAGLLALLVVMAFMALFDIVADALLFCWLSDDMMDGEDALEHPQYAPALVVQLFKGQCGRHGDRRSRRGGPSSSSLGSGLGGSRLSSGSSSSSGSFLTPAE